MFAFCEYLLLNLLKRIFRNIKFKLILYVFSRNNAFILIILNMPKKDKIKVEAPSSPNMYFGGGRYNT